jgi:squalene-associated FAD-dependent desaturase
MSMAEASAAAPRVAIIGGGLAGLAAAVRLAEHGATVELFEARRQLGGRATSFRDPASGALVDHCQHVALGCCTNFLDFCQRTGLSPFLMRHRTLHFFGPDGRRSDLSATRFLPAPLHLFPSLLRLKYLSWREKLGIIRALGQLAHVPEKDDPQAPTIDRWLRDHGQTDRAIELFWSPVIISGLSETLDRAAVPPVRKLFVEAFISSGRGYEMLAPQVPLGEFYRHLEQWLGQNGVGIKLGCPVKQLSNDAAGTIGIDFGAGDRRQVDACIVAVPWRRITELLADSLRAKLPELQTVDAIESAPITAVHLWFDRPITELPHAVLPGRISQWVFNRGSQRITTESGGEESAAYYYQVVISASRESASRPRDALIAVVVREMASIWPMAGVAKMLQSRVVTEQHAVFSVRPGIEKLRPPQKSGVANLFLAGDWTATGWPATMEGAVRSGYLAAEHALAHLGKPTELLVPDLPRSWLASLLIGR